MSTQTRPSGSAEYVSLGLFCQALLNELGKIQAAGGKLPKKQRVLPLAVESLASLENQEPPVRSASAFRSYAQVTALHQVLHKRVSGLSKIDDLKEALSRIQAKRTSCTQRLSLTEKAIKFFENLSQYAVENAWFPQNEIPLGVRNLAATM